MSVGELVPSPEDPVHTLSEMFAGEVDELVVWSNPIPTAVIYQVYDMDVDGTAFRTLLSVLLKMNEGLGTTAHDILPQANNVFLPPSPWPAPVWTLSDLQLHPLLPSLSVGAFTITNPTNVYICDAFFQAAAVARTCSSEIAFWYRAKCFALSSEADYAEGSLIAIASYMNLCSLSNMDMTRLTDVVCSLNMSTPMWLRQQCVGCKFGAVANMSFGYSYLNGTCSCLQGFWGNKCQNECPGGSQNPCSGHGKCAEDGTCWCDRHWSGINCSSCALGWEGEDCIINKAANPSSVTQTVFAQVSAQGQDGIFPTGLQISTHQWVQVVIMQNSALGTVEVYVVPPSGAVSLKSVTVHSNVFVSGGILTFGQIPPELSISVDVGVFQEPPTWVVSDLTLTPIATPGFDELAQRDQQDLFPQSVFTEPMMNASRFAESQSTCAELFTSFENTSTCDGVFQNLPSMKQLCVNMVYSTQDTQSAELLILSLADYCEKTKGLSASPIQQQCNSLPHLGSILPYHGANCTLLCIFGKFLDGTSCQCFEGHWGSSCSNLCPFGPYGVCNANGICKRDRGLCTCSSQWQQSALTTQEFWTGKATTELTYACTACTKHWTGADCSYTVQVLKQSVTWRASLIFGSYITTFDGASLSLVSPGAYLLLSVERTVAKILFLPCPGSRQCRLISRFSIKVDDVLLLMSVSKTNWLGFTVTVRQQGSYEKITFPSTKNYERMDLKWRVESYLRILVDGKLSILISSSASGLSIGAKVHQDWFGRIRGLLGQADGNHINDLHSTATSDSDLTAEEINTHLHKNFMLSDLAEAEDLLDAVAGQNLTTCGHMLQLTNHSVLFTNLNVMIVTQQLTITFWLHTYSSVISADIFQLKTSLGLVTVKVHMAEIIITWLQTSVIVLRPPHTTLWTHLALSWDGNKGILMVFAIQEYGIDYSTAATISLGGADFHIIGMSLLGPQSTSAVEIDLVRIWQVAKSLDSIAVDMKSYMPSQVVDSAVVCPYSFTVSYL
ncbi:hypothetical protein C0Q70_07564 [Pomacea canaliculata]|uniref:EGF-like domain-containing protein n=1 Tax=Pomacea canaliculata TaxID=400727 RepID=A0A2T7PFE6_POMCA|nr:hypothetical protein C0Q70_07564 [Pomacea canaliculata]